MTATLNDRRGTPRFRVQFRSTFSGPTMLEGAGAVLDLSLGGCRIETTTSVPPSVSTELRIHAPDLNRPLMIDGVTMQWVNGRTCGLGFLHIRETERERLRQVIERLADDEEG